MTEWIVERMRSTGERPSSREVRRRARQFCRENGCEVVDDDWLGA